MDARLANCLSVMKKNLLVWLSITSAVGAILGAGVVWFWGTIHDALPPGHVRNGIEGILSRVEHLARWTAEIFIGGFQSYESPQFTIYLLVFSALLGAAIAVLLFMSVIGARDFLGYGTVTSPPHNSQ